MKLFAGTGPVLFQKLLISIGVSAALIALLIHFTLSAADISVWPVLVSVLSAFSIYYFFLYIALSLTRTTLQTFRYATLINAAGEKPPSFFHMFLVTLSRNMFVDMVPARLGELSYIAMLNRGYQISSEVCISSLVISFVFDLIALAVLVFILIGTQLLSGDIQGWLAGALVILSFLILLFLLLCYPVLKAANQVTKKLRFMHVGIFAKVATLLKKIETAFFVTSHARITTKITAISLGIRIVKYFSLYCLFIGVAHTQFPQLTTALSHVLPALISAEAGASMPIPSFLGLGTYEAGGSMALIALGADKSAALIVMLSMHVISQVVDYLLGILGCTFFLFKTKTSQLREAAQKPKGNLMMMLFFILLILAAALFLALQITAVKKRGAVKPPDPGTPILPAATATGAGTSSELTGFIVWSSNRSGNHDIYRYSLADKTITRLTSHPHTEYYPRISPDGTRVVFARSHIPWVSQRNYTSWDIWLLNLADGSEKMLAKNGNTPTWSADGKSVYFQRNENEVVEVQVNNLRERLVHRAGTTLDIPGETVLETPSMNKNGRYLAVTFRKTFRAVAVSDPKGAIRKLGKGCQLTWGPQDQYLYKIDHGGNMQNAVFLLDPKTGKQTKWFDAVGEYSHEYFPRVSADNSVLVYGASSGGHAHDTADYEIFLWQTNQPPQQALRITYHTGNDCWPDIYLE